MQMIDQIPPYYSEMKADLLICTGRFSHAPGSTYDEGIHIDNKLWESMRKKKFVDFDDWSNQIVVISKYTKKCVINGDWKC